MSTASRSAAPTRASVTGPSASTAPPALNWYTADPTLQFELRYRLTAAELDWAKPRLEGLGALMGGPIAERADATDKNPPRLVKYDRWGHDISEVVLPESALATKRDLIAHGFGTPGFRDEATRAGVRVEPLGAAYLYMLCQAEIGMSCSLGADAGMVRAMVELFASDEVKAHVLGRLNAGDFVGKTGQFFTERTGGSDLGELETTATPNGDSWLLNGLKWFSSNCDGEIFVVLAKPVGAVDGVRGVVPFLVMKHRLDGSRNGMKIRQLKDKLGTKAVPSGEVEFADAEAFMMAPETSDGNGSATGDGHGLGRLMALTDIARVGIAMMGVGCARRALVESLCYATARSAWGKRLIDQPLMQRKLAELIVEVEAAQALVFEQYAPADHRARTRLRLGGGAGQAARRAAGDHRRQRRDRGARRQRLRRDLAGRAHPSRRPDQHAVGGARQHPVPRRPPRDRARSTPTARCSRASARASPAPAKPEPKPTTRPHSSPSAPTIWKRRSHPGARLTARPPRRGCSRSPSSWPTSTPARCWSSRPRGSGARVAAIARRWSRGSTPPAGSPTPVRCAASTRRATRGSTASPSSRRARWSTTGSGSRLGRVGQPALQAVFAAVVIRNGQLEAGHLSYLRRLGEAKRSAIGHDARPIGRSGGELGGF